MNFNQIHNVYFIGVGGIGMSALARYFLAQGMKVFGYDKTRTHLTTELESKGIEIHYEDRGIKVLDDFSHRDTLVIYTPAVPSAMGELKAFEEHGFNVIKRAKALGIISEQFETFAVAGTHGKTTTSTILAHVLNQTPEKCNAFVGGIASNYQSNCIINEGSERVVVEADEFDRSFLQLKPDYAILTSIDADHLDIYGDDQQMLTSFNDFLNLMKPNGTVVINSKIDWINFNFTTNLRIVTYGVEGDSDWRLHALKYEDGHFYFDILSRSDIYRNIEFGLPGQHNAENATAVFALCIGLGIEEHLIRSAFKSFKGVERRFDIKIKRKDLVLIDDYAHHPTEIEAFLRSVQKLYPHRKITTIFQPHLFSRTRDFMEAFAEALSLSDDLILLPIYPAREEPIAGITSETLLDMVSLDEKMISTPDTIIQDVEGMKPDIICTLGAGDIADIVTPLKNHFDK
ncbi:MAG: UDP-N-acetylmuramate--L-alanine ligase [Crocinitomicaceae bacterium]